MDKTKSIFSIIKTLHSETKLQIISFIVQNNKKINVNELTTMTGLNRKNVSKQLNELKNIDILEVDQVGKERFYSLNKNLDKKKTSMIMSIINAYICCECAPDLLRIKSTK